jgi:hypothetical protein
MYQIKHDSFHFKQSFNSSNYYFFSLFAMEEKRQDENTPGIYS